MRYINPIFIFSALSFGAFCACGSSAGSSNTDGPKVLGVEDTVTGPTVANLHNPLPSLPTPLLLSGNFGELRNNHFHSGLDFKTGGHTGVKVVSADSGYVSRITVSPWGFGRAVYVSHPRTGLTTVYGHLEAFAPKIDKIAKDKQYSDESFNLDMSFAPDDIPVRRGETIGLSGNSGSSGGPHLHMDVRHTATGDAVDPMPYFRSIIKDNTAPEVRSLALFAIDGKGKVEAPAMVQKTATTPSFTAWGKVSPAIKAYDKMTSTSNIYGVKHLSLEVDGKEVYRRTIDRFSFDDTRAVHTLVDYPTLRRSGSWMMTTYVPQSDPLYYMIDTDNSGILDIDCERTYKCAFILEDAYGNRTKAPFIINGRNMNVAKATPDGTLVHFDKDFRFTKPGLEIEIPAGALYDDIRFKYSASASNGKYLSDIHSIGDITIPLHRGVSIKLDLPKDINPEKLVLVRIGSGKRGDAAVASRIENGKLTAKITNFGKYAITSDSTPPTIRKSKRKLGYIISDNLSGIESYRGEIDGKFALFELDGKTSTLSFSPDGKRFPRNGKQHEVVIYVTDAAGNSSEFVDKVVF